MNATTMSAIKIEVYLPVHSMIQEHLQGLFFTIVMRDVQRGLKNFIFFIINFDHF